MILSQVARKSSRQSFEILVVSRRGTLVMSDNLWPFVDALVAHIIDEVWCATSLKR